MIREILLDMRYKDMECIGLLSTLTGEIEKSAIFEVQCKPYLITLEQLKKDSKRRNPEVDRFGQTAV